MTQRPAADSTGTPPVQDIPQSWEARGYRPELANLEQSPTDDPQGEYAYQRAFAEAAKKNPPRVPNPASYPNSPSAREFIKRKDEAIFSSRKKLPSSPTSADYASATDLGRPKDDDTFPPAHHPPNLKSEPTSDAGPYGNRIDLPLANAPGGRQFAEPRPFSSGPPLLLEPKLDAPLGPSRMLR